MSIVQSNQSQQANFVVGTVKPVITTAAATNYTLTAAQSGSTVFVTGGGAASTITLPAPTTAGMYFDFILSADNAAIIGIVSPTAGTAKGAVLVSAGAAATSAVLGGAQVRCNFTATAKANDRVSCVSDGTNWNFSGQSVAAAGLAFA